MISVHFLLFLDVEHFAIDWLTGNIYFVDGVSDEILVCQVSEEKCVIIVDQDLQNPSGIALDPFMG